MEKRSNERLDNVEKRLEEAATVLTKPVETTAGQRKFLNDRVRAYCVQMKKTFDSDVPYHIVWGQIHNHVGVHGISNFKFPHLIAAEKYLQRMYEDSGLIW